MIDLNCDSGEAYGPWTSANDAALLGIVTSTNIACGGHAGDPDTIRRTVRLAHTLGVALGAHPGFPDLAGFGERAIVLTPETVTNLIIAQVGTLLAFARIEGATVQHVHLHGALYHQACANQAIAQAVADAVAQLDPALILFAPAGSALAHAGRRVRLTVARIAWVDHQYEPDGTLRDLAQPDAILHAPERCLAQAQRIVHDGAVDAHDGSRVPMPADTLCLHSNIPGAAERAAVVRQGLIDAGTPVVPLRLALAHTRSPAR